MGFRLHLKWGFPVQSHFLPKSASHPSPLPFKGREASFDSGAVPFPSVNSGEIGTFCSDPLRYAYSTAMQSLENGYSETEETRINVGKRFCSGLQTMIDDTRVLVGGNESTFPKSLEARKASHLDLLMKNLYILEETFADSNATRLERDILVQLGRLGALNLFHTCLSKTLEASTDSNLFIVPSELNIEHSSMKSTIDDHTNDVVIRSGKKEERKTRRKRALEKADKISALSLPSKPTHKGPRKLNVSSAKRPLNSTKRRLTTARNEAEMSKGVKVIADLERIRTTLEKESGQVVNFGIWAEAAGVEKKVLQQQLHFGWCCRDELVRSTRSLVLYLARNYRGTGIAFEDLLQAGKLGVLQGAERFDPTRGYRFSTYIQYWIRKSMSTLVAKHARGIHIPFTLSRTIHKIQKARKTLLQSHAKYPDDNEIAKLTGLSLPKIRSASKCLRVVGSIDQKMGDFLSVKFLECTRDPSINSQEETVMKQHMKKDLYELLNSLDLRERQVLALRYGLGDHRHKSLAEIGKIFTVSKEWIRKIEKTSLTKLREEETLRNLSYYLDP